MQREREGLQLGGGYTASDATASSSSSSSLSILRRFGGLSVLVLSASVASVSCCNVSPSPAQPPTFSDSGIAHIVSLSCFAGSTMAWVPSPVHAPTFSDSAIVVSDTPAVAAASPWVSSPAQPPTSSDSAAAPSSLGASSAVTSVSPAQAPTLTDSDTVASSSARAFLGGVSGLGVGAASSSESSSESISTRLFPLAPAEPAWDLATTTSSSSSLSSESRTLDTLVVTDDALAIGAALSSSSSSESLEDSESESSDMTIRLRCRLIVFFSSAVTGESAAAPSPARGLSAAAASLGAASEGVSVRVDRAAFGAIRLAARASIARLRDSWAIFSSSISPSAVIGVGNTGSLSLSPSSSLSDAALSPSSPDARVDSSTLIISRSRDPGTAAPISHEIFFFEFSSSLSESESESESSSWIKPSMPTRDRMHSVSPTARSVLPMCVPPRRPTS
eukprot:m.365749 g.365749  ORF g.365749 m.365749 type:complete len:448 (+) comp28090_c0_seq2:53-1396(+)